MQEEYYKALCDEKRCPNVRNECCNPAFNPGLTRHYGQQPQDFYQVIVSMSRNNILGYLEIINLAREIH